MDEAGLNALPTNEDALTRLLTACRHMEKMKDTKRKKRQFDVIYPGKPEVIGDGLLPIQILILVLFKPNICQK